MQVVETPDVSEVSKYCNSRIEAAEDHSNSEKMVVEAHFCRLNNFLAKVVCD